jgi:hypothetical protein
MPTRRKFLRDCSLVAASAAWVPAALARNSGLPIAFMDNPGFEQFAQQVNSPFIVRAGWEVAILTLVEAQIFSAASAAGEDAGNEKFSLLFRSPLQPALAQDTYPFEHSRLGRLSIFIVPAVGADRQHRYYAAIFDRPKNPANLARQLSQAPKRGQKC